MTQAFLARAAAAALSLLSATLSFAQPYFVSPAGDDANPGTREKPFATPARALAAVRHGPGDVFLREGTYYLEAPLVITAEDSGTREKPVVFQSFPGEQAVLSGGVRLDPLVWRATRAGVFEAPVPAGLETEVLFVNGEQQVLARYPNFDPTAQAFDGFAPDAISPERVARWADPAGGYFHAMHPSLWGDFTWRIQGKDADGRLTLEGGWQNNRGAAAHERLRYVENIREELDAPREWFLDRKRHLLFYQPPAGLDLRHALVVAARLRTLVEFRGDPTRPVRWVTLRGLVFRHTARTVMENREPLLRSDWTIHRGGAVLFQGAEDCSLEDSLIDGVGGNAVFVNNYNRRITLRGTQIVRAGASGICFVGDPQAARSPLFRYEQVQPLADLDRTPGPKTDNYPADCLVDDCLIHLTGRVEKQTAGIEIDLAARITVRHCSIYDLPRAGINVGDGCWGGHVIEYCDVFDTVKETGDHGSFNSWGRDRFWRPNIEEVNAWVRQAPDLPRLDAVEPVSLLRNRWRCDHGWDIDLDDGSSNYVIRENLCLHGGLKNREGYRRIVENNVLVDAGYDPHVWYSNSGDVFRRNVVWTAYRPANMPPPPWGSEMDFNLVHQPGALRAAPATRLQEQSGRDRHSLVADARFVDPARGDYRVRDDSPALTLGFVNFPMDRFGVRSPRLRALARTPMLPQPGAAEHVPARDAAPARWCGARVRNILDAGEQSAFGLPGVAGVLVLEVAPESPAARAGLRQGDVILSIDRRPIPDTAALPAPPEPSPARPPAWQVEISRDQTQGVVPLTP